MKGTAGTVSKILWHFTGGPAWNKQTETYAGSLKRPADAYEAVQSILAEHELRLSEHVERFTSTHPLDTTQLTRGFVRALIGLSAPEIIDESITTNAQGEHLLKRDRSTAQVCCVAEIPIQHLDYHAERYGRFAIGFRREMALKAGFRPVLYALDDDWVAQTLEIIFDVTSRLRFTDAKKLQNSSIPDMLLEPPPLSELLEIEKRLNRIASFIKTFKRDGFDTIYAEREWRSTEPYHFDLNQVVMVVVPRDFVARLREDLPEETARVPVVAYEDLLEH